MYNMPNILGDKQFKSYQKVSRYAVLPFYYNTIDDKYVYGTAKNLRTDTPFKVHKIKEGESLDTLALYYYNNPTYYWIIADFNRIRDPFLPLKIGSKIKIPTFSNIEFNT